MAASDMVLGLVKFIIHVYGLITLPFYFLYYRCFKPRDAIEMTKARFVSTSSNEITYKAVPYHSRYTEEMMKHPDNMDTMEKVARWLVTKYNERQCLGTRLLLGEEKVNNNDGKSTTKFIQGEYIWITYSDLERLSRSFARGLLERGVKPRDKVCIFADTRAEWLVAAWACWRNSIAVVTVYTNLGEDGIAYCINQMQVTTVITSSTLIEKLSSTIKQLPSVTDIIYFENPLDRKAIESPADGVDVISFNQLINIGSKSSHALSPPNPEDIAVVMYTSGSTGNPKGVLLTHLNMVSALQALIPAVTKVTDRGGVSAGELGDGSYIGYLPLAHVLEMLAEHVMLTIGVKIGYSSALTLTDTSPGIRAGDDGDLSILKPIGMCCVPLILDRIYKGIQKKIALRGDVMRGLISFCIEYRSGWVERGFDTPIMNFIIFKKFRAITGGNLKLIICGGAPLSQEPQKFISTCLGAPVMQGYGLTETTATACISDSVDFELGHVGPPLMGVHLKITDWDEGGYTVQDPQGPRGEIVIGGKHVAAGYYLMPDKTKEEFYEEDGVRFFKTGDIGQVLEGGRVKIIDRKKDLVKLQAGEYVSLGKVESNLKVIPVVDNICVYADPSKNAVVSLLLPNRENIQVIAAEIYGNDVTHSFENLCVDPHVNRRVLDLIKQQGASAGLVKFEIPKAVHLVVDEWTPESGMVTAAFKLKRKPIEIRYKKDIEAMYLSLELPPNKSVAVWMEDHDERANGKSNGIHLNQVSPQREE